MSMTEEEYESALAHFIPEIKDKMRARDTAQREALAQLQAEMPDLRANMTKALDLLQVLTSTKYTDRVFVEAVDEADEMLEQLRGKVVLKCQGEQQEAQGAQAGDERAAFEDWVTKDQCLTTGNSRILAFRRGKDDEYINEWVEERWFTWKARAALATQPAAGTTSDKYRAELYDEVWQNARSMGYGNVTDALSELEQFKLAQAAAGKPAAVVEQTDYPYPVSSQIDAPLPVGTQLYTVQPAAGEPVAWRFQTCSGGRWHVTTNKMHARIFEGTEDGGQVQELFAIAPPAAAHGDEAVRKDADRYQWLRKWIVSAKPFKSALAGTCLDEAIDAAMRAQGDGEVQ